MAYMNLPIDQVVEVNITREGVAPATANFSNLLYIGINDNQTNPKIPKSERVRTYSSASAVGTDFGTSSDEYNAASAYFGQDPQPSEMLIALRYGGTESPPQGFSKALGTTVQFDESTWNAVTGGAFSFTYNSVVVTIQNLDFSNVKGPYDVVDIINNHFNNFTSDNPNVSFAASPLAVIGENVWTTSDLNTGWKDLNDEYWITQVAPTGELLCNYDEATSTFYFITTFEGRDFLMGSFGAASNGTDITVADLLNVQSATVQPSQMSGSSAIAESDYVLTSQDIAKLKTITDGTLTINNNVVSGINFSEIFNHSGIQEIAALLSMHLGAAFGQEVSANAVAGKIVQQTLSGSPFASSITIGSSEVATAIFGTQTSIPTVSTFLETPAEALVGAQSKTNAFYGVAIARLPNGTEDQINQEILRFAASVQGITKMFFARLYDQRIYSSSKSDIGSSLAAKSFFRTVPCALDALTDGYMDCAAAGRLLTQVPGSSTLFGKTLATINASNQGIGGQNYALGKNVNIQSSIGQVSIFRNGTVSQLSPEYADVIRGIDWLTNEIEVDIFARIASANKIPYTDTGVNILKAELKKALDVAVFNGLLANGLDDKGNLVPSYTITSQRVADVPQAQRQRRIAPTIRFTGRLAGAIQHVIIQGTVSV